MEIRIKTGDYVEGFVVEAASGEKHFATAAECAAEVRRILVEYEKNKEKWRKLVDEARVLEVEQGKSARIINEKRQERDAAYSLMQYGKRLG